MHNKYFLSYLNASTWLTFQWLFNPVVVNTFSIISSVSLLLSIPNLMGLGLRLAYLYLNDFTLHNILQSVWHILPWHLILIFLIHFLMFDLALTNTILFLSPSVRDSVNLRFGPDFIGERGYNSTGKALMTGAVYTGKLWLTTFGIAVGCVAAAGTVDVVTSHQYHETVRLALEKGPDPETIKAIAPPRSSLASLGDSFGSFAAQALTKE